MLSMYKTDVNPITKAIVTTFFVYLLFWIASALVYAETNETEERRVQISLDIFPRIVAVDKDIETKLTSEGKIRLLVLYEKNQASAERLAEHLCRNISNIGGRSIEILVARVITSVPFDAKLPSAIFLAERLREGNFKQVWEYVTKHHVILFSPFIGDVERGATVGIAVSSCIKPYFNLNTLRQSGIRINKIVLKVSKHYE